MTQKYKVLKNPLSLRALKRQANKDGHISVVVRISLDELLGLDLNGLNDLCDTLILSNDIVGSLMDICYQLVGAIPVRDYDIVSGEALIKVNADVSEIINGEN